MTRETKIGLLVGLAFIITVGILLSNYMADRTELAQAPLEIAAKTGHSAVVPPGESNNPIVKKVIIPNEVTPGPVPTRSELDSQRASSDIHVGGPTQPDQQPTHDNGPVVDNSNQTTPPPANRDLADAAKRHGEELVDADRKPVNQTPLTDGGNTIKPGPTVATAANTYTAQPGDNLNKIALKAMGASTKANRDAILKANPKLAANPNLIVAGQSYVIPTSAATGAEKPAKPTDVAILPIQTPKPTERPTPPKPERVAAANVYIVKEGDNSLWGIAVRQCGTPQAVASIKELNKDILKGGDMIRIGMRLKLPNKVVALAD